MTDQQAAGPPGFATRAVHAGYDPLDDAATGDLAPPLHLASTHAMDRAGDPSHGYKYNRLGNPTRDALERRLAAFEDAAGATTFASGMAAVAATCTVLTEPGDEVVAFDACYGGTKLFFDEFLAGFDVETHYVDATDADAVLDAVGPDTALVWLESPTNPLLRLCDVRAIADGLADHPATVAVDNTFASPYVQRPLDLGADLSVYSTTKYLNGHSDSLGGAVVAAEEGLDERLHRSQGYLLGSPLSAFDCFLVQRGSKTLPARMDRHQTNAGRVAEFLVDHGAVERVHYPGLADHPQHDLAVEQMDGFGGIVSFEVDGDAAETRAFVESLSTFTLAVSLGGVESLVEHPWSMSAGYVPEEQRRATGITESLVRATVGIEDPADLLADLDRALDAL